MIRYLSTMQLLTEGSNLRRRRNGFVFSFEIFQNLIILNVLAYLIWYSWQNLKCIFPEKVIGINSFNLYLFIYLLYMYIEYIANSGNCKLKLCTFHHNLIGIFETYMTSMKSSNSRFCHYMYLPSSSTSAIICRSSSSEGSCPSCLITVPSSSLFTVPSPSLSKRRKVSRSSASQQTRCM